MVEDINLIREYVYKCLKSDVWKVREIADGTGISTQTLYGYRNRPRTFKNMSVERLQRLYKYFKSFNFDVNHLERVHRVTEFVIDKEKK